MNKEALVNKLTAVIAQIKKYTKPSIVRDYRITPSFDMKSGDKSGLLVTFVGGPNFVLDEALLNYWKEQLGANDFRFMNYCHTLYLVFFVDYDKS